MKAINMGHCHHRKYIPHLVELTASGAVGSARILSNVESLRSAVDAYKAFDERQPGWMKVELDLAA